MENSAFLNYYCPLGQLNDFRNEGRSMCLHCGNKPNLKCSLKGDTDNGRLFDTPLRGQVFGLPPAYPDSPLGRKKLTNLELRQHIDKYDLWEYIPPWQVPKLKSVSCSICCRAYICNNMPMKKIIRMAKKNMTLDGPIGEPKIDFPRFGRLTTEASLKKKCNGQKSNGKKCNRLKYNSK